MSKSKEWVEFYDDYDPPKQHKMHKSEIIHFLHDPEIFQGDSKTDDYVIQGLGSYYIPVTKETWNRVYQEVQE